MEYRRISLPLTQIEERYSVVVVGSGYGGGIAASRLARAGQSVCLLEKGKEFLPGEFPDTTSEALAEIQLSTPDGHFGKGTGLYDVHVGEDINVVRGCGLGGTSLINANVALQADPRVFESKAWPAALVRDLRTRVAEGYARAEEMLRPKPYKESVKKLEKLENLKRSAAAMDAEFILPPLNVNFEDFKGGNHVGVSQSCCNLCGNCVSGCNVSAKNTTAMTYLPDAYNHGASIFCEVVVDRVERKDGRWCVFFSDASREREKFAGAPELFVFADLVVLAGGALGSTEILLRSAQAGLPLSARLGSSFTGNGDVLGFAYNNDQAVHAVGTDKNDPEDYDPVGPCITGMIDLRSTPKVEDGLTVQEGVIPGALGAILPKTLRVAARAFGRDTDEGLWDATKEGARELDSLIRGPYHGAVQNTQIYLVMTHDGGDGRMELDERGKLRIRWPGIGDKPIFKTIDQKLIEATKANGGTYVRNPLWSTILRNQLLTVHPLGGCPMGEDAQSGVVDHKGQVFSSDAGTATHPGLYVADGSILPCSVGVNPLLTISALAERIMSLIAEDHRWEIDYRLPSAPRVKPSARTIGIEFTESMKGYFSTKAKDDFQAGFERGKADESPFRFILTIRSDDLDKMIADPAHLARMTGTVEAPALSPKPLTVTHGEFNLFVENPDRIGMKNMVYRMRLTDEAGKQYYFHGYKIVRDDRRLDLWPDTTTLYIKVHSGDSEAGPVVGCGILHIAPTDFARQMTTMRALNAPNPLAGLDAVARFGKLFAGDLFDTYGGVVAPNRVLDPNVVPRKRRTLRMDAPSVHTFRTQDGVELRLTRYEGGNKGPVILAPGFGNSAAVYALDTTETSFAEYLFANGYDIWLFDRRSSPLLPAATTDYNEDDVVKYDWPAAVAEVKRLTSARDVQVVAHCMGAMTLLLASMTGMSGVRSAICSQVTTYFFTDLKNRLKAAVKLADLLQLVGIGSVTTNVKANWQDAAIEAALRFYPIPSSERCNDPVCHRIWGIFGPVYTHKNLNNATHRAMREIFGISSTTVFKHLLRILGEGHAVDKDGNDVYMDKIDRLAYPIHFIHGSDNEMAYPKTTEKLYDDLCDQLGSKNYSRTVFGGYGHLDCFVGTNSANDIFPNILEHLNRYN